MSEKKKSAFTLIEMIIVISLIAIVIGITSSIFITGNRVFSKSDVNTTLQIEAQKVQERISDIGMQAESIVSVNGDSTTGEISNIVINSYDKSGIFKDFRIENNSGELKIDDSQISSNLKSIKINKDIISARDDEHKLKEYKVIKFEIILAKNKGFSRGIEYPINFIVTFRNAT